MIDNVMINEYQIRNLFMKGLPYLIDMADVSCDASDFKVSLRSYVLLKLNGVTSESNFNVAKRLLCWIDYDGIIIDEFSTGNKINILTITNLWHFLRSDLKNDFSTDMFLDLYHQFKMLDNPIEIKPDRNKVKSQMNRWPTGLDEEIIVIRQKNKDRIIRSLIHIIEGRHSLSSNYLFSENMTFEEKYKQVSEWWNSSRFHLTMAAKSPTELNSLLGHSLSDETFKLLMAARKKGMPFFVTPYYVSLLNTEKDGYDDTAIRSYVIYSKELVDTYGDIKAWEKEDVVQDGKPNAAGWLLPDGNNIHRRYPEVAILIPDSIGRSCGGLCASCQRMYDFQSKRLNFDFESLKVKENWDKKLRRLMQYFEDDSQIRDILITGGDALMSQNATLRKLLDAVFKMALRKRKANEKRPDGEKYAELQRVRLGSRLLAYLPFRINEELIEILREFKERASRIGVSQFYIQTHFQSPLELTPEAKRAIESIQSAGWTITNQLVYNVAASRRGHTAKLRRVLNSVGVVCYYTFSVKGFQENYSVFTPNSRSIQEEYEEKIFGLVPSDKLGDLHDVICNSKHLGKSLTHFLKENNLLFAGTDRSVLNLPAIGKSMTFITVGLTDSGKRILKFEHDDSRRHSPIIKRIKDVYIVENKSVAAYLRQLADMGENTDEYRTIWNYCEGITEPKFSIYEYPEYPFSINNKMTNLLVTE